MKRVTGKKSGGGGRVGQVHAASGTGVGCDLSSELTALTDWEFVFSVNTIINT